MSAVVALSVATSPIPAMANDALIGGIIGGVIGGAISNSNKQRSSSPKRTYKASKPSVSTAQRESNRQAQVALNYFGFNSGTPDGVLGRNSRAAISAFQAHLGYTPSGQLTSFERDFLISSYYRAQAGGPNTAQLIASNPQGVRGLLTIYRDEQMNGSGSSATAAIGGHYGLPSVVAAAVNEVAKSSDPSAEQLVQRHGFIQLADINGDGQTDYIIDTSVTGSAFWCNAQACTVRVFASTPDGYERNDFQAFNVTPAMFSCVRGTCTKTDNAPQMAAANLAPQAAQPALPQTQMAAAPAAAAPALPVPSAQAVVSGQVSAVAAAPVAQLPSFMAGGQAPTQQSLASFCNKVSLLTSSNGGFVTAATLSDPDFALAEQMCLTRTYAMAQGEELIAKVQGATPDQITAQCKAFGPVLKDHVLAVSLKSRDEVLQGVSSFILSSGMSPQQLAGTARVCLSVGYRVDDMDVAMGSALLLTSLGEAGYAELLGHHLSQGIGATKRGEIAAAWYEAAMTSFESNGVSVFAPGQPERMGLVQKAAMMMSGQPSAAAPVTQPQEAALPLLVLE
ncbi:peptidoglycan-binding domain-containing protein [Marivita sp. XM-24bin2]|jgi:peptidoglycan hydrolase-like protein with peptidoglycan-binding domain|uniref:peptidoglycan-binding domain-containing protein n=1 Tax=unclassified Marivita TaxID=2632480 RepID=UPI000D7AE3D7|nr:peptidoglycan-binding domain-containing protein [Marivita sp. XM-24bin2]PWL34460.1 MAG: peptidoglycan-binding protein [Marivita sp. XM-24bin2]